MIIGTLFLLHHEIKQSQLGQTATVVAFLYPALWGAVAALAVLLFVLHGAGERRMPMAILTTGVSIEAIADFIYASQLMQGTYQTGGWPSLALDGIRNFHSMGCGGTLTSWPRSISDCV